MSREMKDSGVEWIGAIPRDWLISKYKNICEIKNGYAFDSSKFSLDNGFPLIRIRDITSGNIETYYTGEYNEEYIVRKNDLLVGMDGDFNVRWWDNQDALLNQRCMKITAEEGVSNRFIYYSLPFQLKIINDLSYATTVKHLSHFDVLNSKIAIPSIEQQLKITTFLDDKTSEINSIVNKTEQSIEELKAYKQSLITETVTKGLNPDAPMKDSGIEWIGEIPVEWSRTKMKNVCSIGSGTTPKSSNDSYYNGDIYWIQSGDLYQKKYIQDTNKKITEKALIDTSSLRLFNAPYLVVAMYGASIGNVSISNIDATVNQAVGVIEPSSIDTKYLYYVLTASRPGFLQYSVGGTQPNISQTIINNWIVPLPPLDEQEHISKYLENITQQVDILINKKHQMIKELESYKQSLIYEYVTGKKEVE